MFLSNSTIYFDDSSQSLHMSNNTSNIMSLCQSTSIQNSIVKSSINNASSIGHSSKKISSTKKSLQPLPKQKSRIRKSKKQSEENVVSKEFHFKELDKEEFIEEISQQVTNESSLASHLFGDISLAALTKEDKYLLNFTNKQNSSNLNKTIFSQNKKVEKITLVKSPSVQGKVCQQENNSSLESSQSLELDIKNDNNSGCANNNNTSNNFSFLQIEFESLQETSSNLFNAAQTVQKSYATEEQQMVNNFVSSKLQHSQESVNQIIYHLANTDCYIQQNHADIDIYGDRKAHFDAQVQNIIQNQIKNDSTPFFYIKTFVNYKTKCIENKEIGYSKELLSLLKLTKNTHEFINSALRNEIPEIFGSTFNQQLGLYFLENLSNSSSAEFTGKDFFDNIQSFDDIQIPAKLNLEKISVPFQCEANLNLQFIDNFVTIVKISIDSQIKNQISSLRCKLQKRQSFRYRTLFPTMQKRKQKIDKFFKNQQSQLKISQYLYIQNFLEKFYPKQLHSIESELKLIKNDLETNKSNKTVITNLLDHIIKL